MRKKAYKLLAAVFTSVLVFTGVFLNDSTTAKAGMDTCVKCWEYMEDCCGGELMYFGDSGSHKYGFFF